MMMHLHDAEGWKFMREYDACLYRLDTSQGWVSLEAVPLDRETHLPIFEEIVEVTNVDDDEHFVICVNTLLDASFTLADFPGR